MSQPHSLNLGQDLEKFQRKGHGEAKNRMKKSNPKKKLIGDGVSSTDVGSLKHTLSFVDIHVLYFHVLFLSPS